MNGETHGWVVFVLGVVMIVVGVTAWVAHYHMMSRAMEQCAPIERRV